LYPDTYEIYVDSSEETVIGKMLDRMNVIYGVAYRTRAEELGMDMDEVITLASMIEKEGKADTFDKVSAVFHNRLDQGMALGSDVTVQYALGVRRLVLTQEELAVDSAYNTYVHTGLPVGAICNPGNAAIEAALYPDSDYVEEGYLYFVLTDPETGELAFTKTLEEHDAIVEQYRPLWEAYDQASQQKTEE
ncbi:MAG: endolytic transglycosylase MltG, partial [Candidatus Spyradocola sp.]